MRAYHRGDRIARQAHQWRGAKTAGKQRLSGPHGHTMEGKFDLAAGERPGQ